MAWDAVGMGSAIYCEDCGHEAFLHLYQMQQCSASGCVCDSMVQAFAPQMREILVLDCEE